MSNDEESRTIYCGNLSEKVTDSILYELFLQVNNSFLLIEHK